MPKFGLGKLFRHYWALLGVLCVLLGLGLCFGVELKTTPSARETFSLFMDVAYGSVETEKLQSHIKEVDPSIKLVGVLSFDPASSDYETYYSSAISCDLYLFSGDYLKDKDLSEFASLDTLGVSDGYQVDGVTYGLKANLTENEYFPVPQGTYYCFFSKTSVHLGSLSDSSQSELALTLAKDLFRVSL